VQWPGGVAVVREYGALALVRFDPRSGAFDLAADAARYPLLPAPGEWPVRQDQPARLGPWTLRATLEEGAAGGAVPEPGPWTACFDWDALCPGGDPAEPWPLVLRPRRPGERMRPLGLGGRTRRLQDVLTEARVPQRLRDHLALAALPGGEVLWVPGPGGRQSELAKITPATRQRLVLTFTRD
jgi:tRNA(Ile)-lysidine synthetase-like protein